MNFEGRVALITGGMGGLGETISTKMADAGYHVVVTYSPSNKGSAKWLADMKEKIALPVDHLMFNPNNSPAFEWLRPWQLLPAILDQREEVGGATDIHRTREATKPKGLALVKRQLRRRGIKDERVLAAMSAVPREHFVPDQVRRSAYNDSALPIGHEQTISQPWVVAAICQALRLVGRLGGGARDRHGPDRHRLGRPAGGVRPRERQAAPGDHRPLPVRPTDRRRGLQPP